VQHPKKSHLRLAEVALIFQITTALNYVAVIFALLMVL